MCVTELSYGQFSNTQEAVTDNFDRERIIPSKLTGSINETYYSGLNDVSGPQSQ